MGAVRLARPFANDRDQLRVGGAGNVGDGWDLRGAEAWHAAHGGRGRRSRLSGSGRANRRCCSSMPMHGLNAMLLERGEPGTWLRYAA